MHMAPLLILWLLAVEVGGNFTPGFGGPLDDGVYGGVGVEPVGSSVEELYYLGV